MVHYTHRRVTFLCTMKHPFGCAGSPYAISSFYSRFPTWGQGFSDAVAVSGATIFRGACGLAERLVAQPPSAGYARNHPRGRGCHMALHGARPSFPSRPRTPNESFRPAKVSHTRRIRVRFVLQAGDLDGIVRTGKICRLMRLATTRRDRGAESLVGSGGCPHWKASKHGRLCLSQASHDQITGP